MKKLARVLALVAVVGLGLSAGACTSPVAPESEQDIDWGSSSIDWGSSSIDWGSSSIDWGSSS